MSKLTSVTDDQIRQTGLLTGGSMLIVGIRCILQYIVLPFVLPLIGLSSALSISLSALLELVALAAIVYNVRRLWHTSWRWGYLGFSLLIVPVILIFLMYDLRALLAAPL